MASYKKEQFPRSEDRENGAVLNVLKDMYRNVLHLDIIESVARSQRWDLDSTCRILSEMTNKVAPANKNGTKKKTKQAVPLNSVSYGTGGGDDDDADVLIESESNQQAHAPGRGVRRAPGGGGERKKRSPVAGSGGGPKSKKEHGLEAACSKVLQGNRVMVILRGLPGSGKSQMARQLLQKTIGYPYSPAMFIFSTDDYFMNKGHYKYNSQMLQEAHGWNQRRVYEAARNGLSPVIVDNTNTQAWEMRAYAMTAVQFGYQLEVLEPETPWAWHVAELTRRNVHQVPKQRIADMALRYERNISGERLVTLYGLFYQPGKCPPQPRHYPPLAPPALPSFTAHPPPPPPLMSVPLAVPVPAAGTIPAAAPSQAPRKKKQRRKSKTRQQPRQQEEQTPFETISNAELEESDTWESDTEGAWEEVQAQDLLSTSVPDNMEYVLVSADNTLLYQKEHPELLTPTVTAQQSQQADLINFCDSPPKEKRQQITTDINLSDVRAGLQSVTLEDAPLDKKQQFTFPKLDFGSLGVGLGDPWEDLFSAPSTAPSTSTQPSQLSYSRELLDEMELKEIATNTHSTDFVNVFQNDGEHNVKVLFGTARDINSTNQPKAMKPPPKVLMLHKGTMTGVENVLHKQNSQCVKKNEHFEMLVNLFPHVERDVLGDILDKCHGDVNWTVDLLLESSNTELDLSATAAGSHCKHHEECACTTNYDLSPDPVQLLPPQTTEPAADVSAESLNNVDKQSKARRKCSLDDSIKKHLEEQFKIDDKHYSQYLLNLRRRRHGHEHGEAEAAVIDADAEASTSADATQEESCSESDSWEEELVEMNLGGELVAQLEQQFGGREDWGEYPTGFQPVVQMPVGLARQLHTLWLESVYTQMQAQTAVLEQVERQDKEFARQLQQRENELAQAGKETGPPPVPDLQEIMDMEIALAVYRTDQEQWKRETPQDLASRMTRQKLFEAFPSLDKDILVEILQAHDNSFDQTVHSLLCSIGRQENEKVVNVGGRILPKNCTEELARQKQLLETTKQEPEVKAEGSKEVESVEMDAKYYREQAAHHLKMRGELFRKAQESIQKGLPQVASYYSDVAKLHMQKFELANNRAACAFLTEHTESKGRAGDRTIDLHYLYVREAEQALAIFIDTQVSRLQQSGKPREALFIITGRGSHSVGGVSQIKPAVKRRLKERKLAYVEINPGLLKVVVTRHSILTNDLRSS